MGFPDWTLWGIGLSLAGALLALILALLGQAPGFLKRTGLSGARLEQHVRAYTGYALALVLLACGFFIAGVPLGSNNAVEPQISVTQLPEQEQLALVTDTPTGVPPDDDLPSEVAPMTPATPETGAFSGPPPEITEEELVSPDPELNVSPLADDNGESESPGFSTSTPSPTRVQPTNTPSATPTSTASPTLTPTPILSETAMVDTAGSTIWVLRSPGGQNLVTVTDGDLVIVLPKHANQGGILWRQIRTVKGMVGWVQEQFLNYDV